MDEFDMQL